VGNSLRGYPNAARGCTEPSQPRAPIWSQWSRYRGRLREHSYENGPACDFL